MPCARQPRATWNRTPCPALPSRAAPRSSGGSSTPRSTTRSSSPRSSPTTTATIPGLDGRMHVARGLPQYTNVSGWDIYRSQVPLLTMLEPKIADGLVVSLVRDASQDGGFLPRWEYMDLSENEMGGDSADPIIADAYAFGARGYDVKTALTALVAGADTTTSRAGQRGRLRRTSGPGLLPRRRLRPQRGRQCGDLPTSSLSPDMASLTLEYATDDFSISRARAGSGRPLDRHSLPATIPGLAPAVRPLDGAHRAEEQRPHRPCRVARERLHPDATPWRRTGSPASASGAFKRATPRSTPGWCPRTWPDSSRTWAGTPRRRGKLTQFLSQLNAGPTAPYDWAGNEPDLGAPFVADYTGAPCSDRADDDQNPADVLHRRP